jgi:hypothetical protein
MAGTVAGCAEVTGGEDQLGDVEVGLREGARVAVERKGK